MATFTIMLGDIIDSGARIWDADDPYPIFDESYRDPLNKKIQEHYWFYEIGHETIGIFTFALNRKMREIMPYYNQLYESQGTVTDPLATMDYTDDSTIHNETDTTTEQNNVSTNTSTGASRAVSSETPQVRLSGDEDYASSSADTNSKTDALGNSETTGTQGANTDGTVGRHVKGSQGHQAALLMQYRQSILNIDMNVISDLENLFMSVLDNGDEFAGGEIYYGWTYGWIGAY